jgi:hypothetical protein
MTLRKGFGELLCTYSHIFLPPASNGKLNLPEHMSSVKIYLWSKMAARQREQLPNSTTTGLINLLPTVACYRNM